MRCRYILAIVKDTTLLKVSFKSVHSLYPIPRPGSLIPVLYIGRIVGSLNNTEAAEYPIKPIDLEIGTDHLRPEERSLLSRRDLVSTRSRSYSPRRPAEITALAEWRDMHSCRPGPRSIQESDMGS